MKRLSVPRISSLHVMDDFSFRELSHKILFYSATEDISQLCQGEYHAGRIGVVQAGDPRRIAMTPDSGVLDIRHFVYRTHMHA
ncbi:hypothetical protein PM082_009996 [Marasmius tenuissimus]|nr:hypothetical protein PM082_009996 [Marasmius tenuissimus]